MPECNSKLKILIYGYYDDFSHFFAKVSNDLSSRIPLNKIVFSTGFISGALAWNKYSSFGVCRFLGLRVLILSILFRFRYPRNIPLSLFRGYRPKWLLEYEYRRVGKYTDIYGLLAKISVVDDIFSELKPDHIIISGDARVTARIFMAAAKRRGCTVSFFEQGPWGTTFCDKKGVNAFLSTPGILENNRNDIRIDESIIRQHKEGRGKVFRSMDYLVSLFPFWPEEYKSRIPLGRVSFSRKYKNLEKEKKDRREILFAMQVPDDANFVLHSDFFDFESIVRVILCAMSDDMVLAVREHPKYSGAYGKGLYKLIDSSSNAYLQKDLTADEALSRCHVVITINSMMGLEALQRRIPVFILGRSYYQSICYGGGGLDRIVCELSRFLRDPEMDWNMVSKFLSSLFLNSLLIGHFRDVGSYAAHNFSSKVIEHLRIR